MYLSEDEWIKKFWQSYKMEYYSALKKWRAATEKHMNGPGGHYVK